MINKRYNLWEKIQICGGVLTLYLLACFAHWLVHTWHSYTNRKYMCEALKWAFTDLWYNKPFPQEILDATRNR